MKKLKSKKLKAKLDLRRLKNHFRVAIFGSARIKKGDNQYKQIYNLAKLIAKEDIDVVTGGGPGVMDAANLGHHAGRKKGNHSLSFGLTIHLPREQRESYHLDIKRDFYRFSNRLDHFVVLSNVIVVTPGGIGTLLELMYTWQLVQVKQVCNMPIILVGNFWDGFVKWIKSSPLKHKFIDMTDLDLLFHAKDANEAMKIINATHEVFKSDKDKTCVNIKNYLLSRR
mgnify:CR=1 FL=1